MMKSLAARIVFAPKDMSDAREISEELGFVTVKTRSRSRPAYWSGSSNRTPTVNESEQRRALRLPQELKDLGTEQAIVFYEGLPPILCRKIRYYQERVFKKRLRPPPPPTPQGARPAAPMPTEDSAASDPFVTGGEIRMEDLSVEEGEAMERTNVPLEQTAIEALTLEDFVVPEASVAAVEAAGSAPSSAALKAQAAAFLASLET
jgi:type IV secretion system protein VirD4